MMAQTQLRVRNTTRGTLLADRAVVAGTSKERRTGLLKRTGLEAGEGMWIAPCECIHTFGMKFPIDVLFLSKKRTVVKIAAAVPRRRIAAAWLAHSVLELPAGTIAQTQTAVGDQLVVERAEPPFTLM